MLLLLPPMVGALALALAVGGHRGLALFLLPVVLAAGIYLRRFGPPVSASRRCSLRGTSSGSC